MSNFQREVEEENQLSELGSPTGFAQNFVVEKVPQYRLADSQTRIEGKHNAFISLRRDGLGAGNTSPGGRGMTSCGAIDIVVGLDSANGAHERTVDPSPFNDASRIYLTQKGKIDNDFGITKGSSMGDEEYTGGIAVKSDKVNIIGRDHIKIVTGKALVEGEERNAGGGKFSGTGRIDLIAGNHTGELKVASLKNLGTTGTSQSINILQPVLKGDNTAELLTEMIDKLTELNKMILENRVAIAKIGNSYINHAHVGACAVGPVAVPPSPMAALAVEPVIKSFSKITDNFIASVNDGGMKVNYLINSEGPTYIKSKGVSTT